MILIATIADIVFLLVAFGVRTLVQVRRTGDAGWRLGRPQSAAEAVARLSIVAGVVTLGVALATADPGTGPIAVFGVALAASSIALVTVAQLQMGSSWRIGVDHGERTALISHGIFAAVRNPIYTGMAAYSMAHVAMTPSPWAVAGAVAMTVGVHVQARLVEEPYLRSVHGAAFVDWAARAGRFLPGLGRIATGR